MGFLLLPKLTWGIFDASLTEEGAMISRYLGVTFIALFLLCWLNRESDDSALNQATLILSITDTLGFIVSLLVQLSDLPNALGWINVLLWLLLAAGNIYFHWFA